jgi:hypothetical protein
MSGTEREQPIAALQALVALLEGRQSGDALHRISASFFPHGAEETAAIMTGLPLSWKAGRQTSEYQHIDGKAAQFDVTIFAGHADVGTQTGVTEVPVWEMRPEIAALLESKPGKAGEQA